MPRARMPHSRKASNSSLTNCPVAIGLMASTCWLLVREAPGAWRGTTFIVVALALLLVFKRLPPLVLIAAAGVAGGLMTW